MKQLIIQRLVLVVVVHQGGQEGAKVVKKIKVLKRMMVRIQLLQQEVVDLPVVGRVNPVKHHQLSQQLLRSVL